MAFVVSNLNVVLGHAVRHAGAGTGAASVGGQLAA